MTEIPKIMVAVDFSSYSESVADYGVSLAKKTKSELIFLHVLNQRQIATIKQTLKKLNYDRMRFSLEDYIQEMIEDREAEMASLVKKMKVDHIPYRLEIVLGVPSKEILNAAVTYQVEMVIIGVKGKTDFKEVLVGSTALRLFRHCPVPLVSVRNSQN